MSTFQSWYGLLFVAGLVMFIGSGLYMHFNSKWFLKPPKMRSRKPLFIRLIGLVIMLMLLLIGTVVSLGE